MITLRCERYPNIIIVTQHGKVRFEDGAATVTQEQADSVLAMPRTYDITQDQDQDDSIPAEPDGDKAPQQAPAADTPPVPPAEPVPPAAPVVVERPAPSAPKADWVAYADSQDPGDHGQLTKTELIEQYGG